MAKTRGSKERETVKENKTKSTLGVPKTNRASVNKAKNIKRKGSDVGKNAAGNNKKKSTAKSRLQKKVIQDAKKEITAPMAKKNASIKTGSMATKKGKTTKTNEKLVSHQKDAEVAKKKELPTVYQFKISLIDSEPLVWRRIQVPKGYSLYNFHIAIIESMGWSGMHRHTFYIRDPRKKCIVHISSPMPFDLTKQEIDEKREKINKYFPKKTEVAEYEYDIADSWMHEILFEGEVPRKQGEHYPQCIDGEHACPPEESGGIEGYKNLCEIIKNPKHPEYEDMKSWLDDMGNKNFNPNKFDIKKVHLTRPGGYMWVQM